MSIFQRASPGHRIHIGARQWNAMNEAAEAFQRHKLDGGSGKLHSSSLAPFVITGSTADATGNRYTYAGTRAYKSAVGTGNWAAMTGYPSVDLYNLVEFLNDGSSDATAVEDGAVVWAFRVVVDDAVEWWFDRGGAGGGSGLPPGGLKYQVLQRPSDDPADAPVWDWVRAHDDSE